MDFSNAEEALGPSTKLRALIDTQATGLTIREGLVNDLLAVELSLSVEFKFYANPRGNTRITLDSPFLEVVDSEHLDKNGIVLPGTIVTPEMVAVSAVSPLPPAKASREKALLAAIFGESDEQQVRNSSSYFAAENNGYVVTAVTRENIRDRPKYSEPGLIDRVVISLRRQDPLSVGDFAEIAGRTIVVVDIVGDAQMPIDAHQQCIDAIVPQLDASHIDGAVQSVSVRRQLPPARDTVRDSVESRSVGPYSLISLMPLKGRGVRGQQVTAAEIDWLLGNQFPAIAAELVSLKCDDTFNRKKLRELHEGRFAFPLATEFGASESFFIATEELRLLGLAVDCESQVHCNAWRIAPASKEWLMKVAPLTIKKPETINYRTYRPEKGGLFCEEVFGPESHARRQRASHFELAAPIVPILFRIGEQSILSQILGLKSEVIESIASWRLGLDQQQEVVSIDSPNCVAKGAEAIQRLLAEHKGDLPFDVNTLIQRDVYVIPSDFRPLVLLDSGNFATSDLNDLYRRIINRSNRLRKLRELNAPQAIIDSEVRELQLSVDQLQANGWAANPVMGEHNRPLRSCIDLVLPRICGKDLKRVDWSAAARAIVDHRMVPGYCTIPQGMFDCLKCKPDEPILLTSGKSFVACLPILGEDLAIRMHGSVAAKLKLSSGDNCVVHRPITTEAVAEANRMRVMNDARFATYITAIDPNTQLQMLLSRVLSGEPLMLDTPQLFLLGGTPSLRRLPDEESPQPEDDIRVMKKPVLALPSLTELIEVVESTERASCVFRALRSEDEPLAHLGRIGGCPWLPLAAEWPKTQDGKPVPFFAQLPVSPSLNDSLPFSVDTDMLLTVFWCDEWWDADSTMAPCVLLHGTSGLHLRALPEGLAARPLFRIESQLKKHLPHWSHVQRVLQCNFDIMPDELLDDLKKEVNIAGRQVVAESRIGGHGYWIQDSMDDFVAQIVAQDECEFSFGDGGSLYIYGHSADRLAAGVQSH